MLPRNRGDITYLIAPCQKGLASARLPREFIPYVVLQHKGK